VKSASAQTCQNWIVQCSWNTPRLHLGSVSASKECRLVLKRRKRARKRQLQNSGMPWIETTSKLKVRRLVLLSSQSLNRPQNHEHAIVTDQQRHVQLKRIEMFFQLPRNPVANAKKHEHLLLKTASLPRREVCAFSALRLFSWAQPWKRRVWRWRRRLTSHPSCRPTRKALRQRSAYPLQVNWSSKACILHSRLCSAKFRFCSLLTHCRLHLQVVKQSSNRLVQILNDILCRVIDFPKPRACTTVNHTFWRFALQRVHAQCVQPLLCVYCV